ncbi:MAG: tetratricopeptide repeat protein [Desulfobacterales bacterium]|nr:tetratricopeptide repeat protein [Desulfobacterales bacterium]
MNPFKKIGIYFLIFFVPLITIVEAGERMDLTEAFLNGIKHYKVENFDAAVTEFNKIVDAGIHSGKVFYNLGNAYLKSGDIGRAIFWFERAVKLMPHDPDLKFNLDYALSLVKDEKEDKTVSVYNILFFWNKILNARTIQWIAVISNGLFWLFLALKILFRKKVFKLQAYLVLIPTAIFTLTTFFNLYEARYIKHAIIIPEKVAVRSGLNRDSTELFVLHAGTKVKIQKENKDFYRIYFSDGKIGWIRKYEVAII